MANHKTTISVKARPGDLSRKNSADHATLSTNCVRKSCIGAAVRPAFRQTIQAAIAIARYKIVQTGPNSQLGGFHLGLLSPSYHGRRLGVVSSDPIPAAPRQTTMQTRSRISDGYTSAVSNGELSLNLLRPDETPLQGTVSDERPRAKLRLSSVLHGISLRERQRNRADPSRGPRSPKASQPT